jgi:hypothetical protein
MSADAERLGRDSEALIGLAAAWRGEDCTTARRRLPSEAAETVAAIAAVPTSRKPA